MTKYNRYQDYVIKDGKLIGEFETMYKDYEDPWEQSTREEYAIEKSYRLYSDLCRDVETVEEENE